MLRRLFAVSLCGWLLFPLSSSLRLACVSSTNRYAGIFPRAITGSLTTRTSTSVSSAGIAAMFVDTGMRGSSLVQSLAASDGHVMQAHVSSAHHLYCTALHCVDTGTLASCLVQSLAASNADMEITTAKPTACSSLLRLASQIPSLVRWLFSLVRSLAAKHVNPTTDAALGVFSCVLMFLSGVCCALLCPSCLPHPLSLSCF